MYLSATVLAMILVSCHAFVPGNLESVAEDKAEPLALTYDLTKFLESLKDSLRKGNAKLGIPVLDPLKKDHVGLDLKNKIVELEGALDNLRAHHLSDYTVNKGEFALIGMKLGVNLTWNEIDLMTMYKITNGKIIDAFSVYGEGSITAMLKNLKISIQAALTVNDDSFLYVRELTLGLHLGKLDLSISGLFNDDEVSKILSQIISELIPQIVEDYQQQVSKFGSDLVASLLNKVLGKLTIDQLMEMLGGGK